VRILAIFQPLSILAFMELVRPSVIYRDSYLAAKQEEGKIAEKNRDWVRYDLMESDFPAYVQSLLDRALGKGLPPGYVPDSRFWLVDNGEYIGSASIRHSLNEYLLTTGGHIGYNIRPSKRMRGYGKAILRLALPEARKLGLDKVLLTCDETNIGSRKIIEANGGILEDKRPNPEGGPDKLRFWITL
jgi:predicted acetyltransferase